MIRQLFEESPYILGVMKINQDSFVHFHLDGGYVIPKSMIPSTVEVKGPTPRNEFNYVILSSATEDVDSLIKMVNDVIQFNKEKKAKETLFEETIKSLERIFNESSVDDLITLVSTLSKKEESDE